MRTLVALSVLVFAGGVSFILRRRQADAPASVRGAVPYQLNLKDFSCGDKKWLVAVFTSSTCDACRDVATKARVLESSEVAVEIIDFLERDDVHKRYQIGSVPTTVIADIEGVVRYATVGPLTATDLWAALAKCRDPKVLSDVPSCRDENHDH